MFALFGVYATAPGLHSGGGSGGRATPVGVEQEPPPDVQAERESDGELSENRRKGGGRGVGGRKRAKRGREDDGGGFH